MLTSASYAKDALEFFCHGAKLHYYFELKKSVIRTLYMHYKSFE